MTTSEWIFAIAIMLCAAIAWRWSRSQRRSTAEGPHARLPTDTPYGAEDLKTPKPMPD
jgi:hypothetical protein